MRQPETSEGAERMQMEKQEVMIGGEAFAVITREAAERIIREAQPQTLAATALRNADENHDGFASLDLTSGEIVSMHKGSGESFRPGGPLVHLYEVSASMLSDFGQPAMVPNIIGSDEAQEIVEKHVGMPGYAFDEDDIEASDVDDLLDEKGDGESYESRWCDAYLHAHGNDPDPTDILRQSREDLDEVYREVE